MPLTSCKACGKEHNHGITLFNKPLCPHCEEEISHMESSNGVKYEFYKSVIKSMWIDYIMATQ